MRTVNNRHKVTTLFILGAVASKSITKNNKPNSETTTPLDFEFTGRIASVESKRNHKWVNESKKRVIEKFLYHTKFHELGLERAISQQISDLDFLKAINPRRGNQNVDPIDYLEDVTHLISYILFKARIRDTRILEKFISKYFDYDDPQHCPNRIITFNYDTLIDSYLLRKFKNPQSVYFDSILHSQNSKKSKIDYSHPIILKLHGSTNWKCTKTEFKKIFEQNDATIIDKSKTKTYNTEGCHYIEKIWVDKKLENPGNDIFPLIIPPIPDKPITNVSIFRYLWTYAFEYLSECQEVVVSGYSLPDTDSLATSLFSKFKNTRLKKLTIIDPSPTTVLKWVALFNRNGISTFKTEYYTDFEEYLKKL